VTALDANSSAQLVAETKMAHIVVVVVVDTDVDLEGLVDKSAWSRSLADPAGNVRR